MFVLFVVAVFWSLMADVFTREQAGRLFGFIAAGISVGGLFGPFLGQRLAQPIGTVNLLLVSAALLAGSLAGLLLVLRWHRRHGENVPAGEDRDTAAATVLIIMSIVLLTTVELLRRRGERLRGIRS